MILGPGIRQQIVRMLSEGISVEGISESLGLPIEQIAIESERSTRKGTRENNEARRALEEHFDTAVQTLGELAAYAENEGVKAKVAMYLSDVKLGLKEPKKEVEGTSISQINIYIQEAQKAYVEQLKRAETMSAEVLKLNAS